MLAVTWELGKNGSQETGYAAGQTTNRLENIKGSEELSILEELSGP